MSRTRGFGIIVYLVLALAILAMLSGIAWKIRESGKDAIRVEWAAANRLAEAEQARKRLASEEVDRQQRIALQQAQKEAKANETKWKQERAKARNVALAGCSAAPRMAQDSTAKPPEGSSGGVRFTWRFVMLYDTAWTGQAGQPVFGHNPTPEGAGADTLSPIGPQELTDTHQENAARCSEDRRNLNNLIETIERLRLKWDKG